MFLLVASYLGCGKLTGCPPAVNQVRRAVHIFSIKLTGRTHCKHALDFTVSQCIGKVVEVADKARSFAKNDKVVVRGYTSFDFSRGGELCLTGGRIGENHQRLVILVGERASEGEPVGHISIDVDFQIVLAENNRQVEPFVKGNVVDVHLVEPLVIGVHNHTEDWSNCVIV